jgi:HJR/Mrr/RecB family endonuclease
MGFRTRLTQQTCDGGADVIVLDDNGGNLAIVEVKRFSKDRCVGIALVDRLIGAAIRWQVRKAYLVTSGRFSRFAEQAAVLPEMSDLKVELWDAHRILNELQCYNDCYLPLHLIDPDKPLSDQQR